MMDDSLKLQQNQRLQQRLSPLQVRYGRMLEMSGPEMEEEVERMLDENPALAKADDMHPDTPDDGDFNETAEEIQMADYRDDDMPTYRLEASNHSTDDREYAPELTASLPTLAEQLNEQLNEFELSPEELETARYVIGNLDDNGYLRRDAASMAYDIEEHTGIHIPTDTVRRMIDLVRTLDPAGVCAVDLRDCLLLQLRRRTQTPDVRMATDIVSHYFDIFSLKHYDKLCAMLPATDDELRAAVDTIRQLNPKPASYAESVSATEQAQHIIPDFAVDNDGDNITVTVLNRVPELQIESSFRVDTPVSAAASGTLARQASLYVKQRRDEAHEFIRLLQMRQTTLHRVMEAIARLQSDFFTGGGDRAMLRPMILKDVAAITGYDLSVISRATAGKYVATDSGLYPLKMFFNERLRPTDDETSSHEIMEAIRVIVEHEDKRHPLSDEAITSGLAEKGYDIARRTVAKYREKLGLPVARLRKEI